MCNGTHGGSPKHFNAFADSRDQRNRFQTAICFVREILYTMLFRMLLMRVLSILCTFTNVYSLLVTIRISCCIFFYKPFCIFVEM